MEASASSASVSASSLATGQLLDKCYRHLESQGFGPMSLATLQIEECEEIAKQLDFELNLPYSKSIVEALAIWIQEARSEAKLLLRTYGLLADDITWRQLAPAIRQAPIYVEEPRPPPGDKSRKLLNDGQNTLKRYVASYRFWRIFLQETKITLPPGKPADLVQYLLARKDEPCGRSVPESIMKAIR